MGKIVRVRRAAWMLAALLLSCLMVGLVGCGSESKGGESLGSGTLRVGVRSDIVGFGYLNEETGKHYGLEIDIAEEMAQRMGYADVEFVTALPENRKDLLQDGKVDCLVACYSVSETRLANFDFTSPYYDDVSIAMVTDSSLITDIDSLKGMTFGTMSGSNTAPQLVIKLTERGFTSGEPLTQTEDNSDT